ncbi:MAG: hypothetical protein HYZ24_06095 [Chloroflexi bacterium]|nr:hypothetical protein [Chloroflexota bacterium]
MTTPKLIPYSAQDFKGRIEEIKLVKDLTAKIASGKRKAEEPNVITFRGIRTMGKTWLALHLKRTILPQIDGVTPLLLGLSATFDPENYIPQGTEKRDDELFADLDKLNAENPTPEEFCVKALKWIAKQLGTTTTEKAEPSELSRWLVRDIKAKYSHKVIALIVDSAFEANWEYLKKLEEYLLVPLAALPNALIILTGRGNAHPWISPYLRIADEQQVKALNCEETEKQVGERLKEIGVTVEKLMDVTGGNPGLNYFFAYSIDWKSASDTIINLLLDIYSEKYTREIRIYFEALCVLDGFNEDEISLMLAKYHNDEKYVKMTDEDKRTVKQKMLETHLVRWKDGKYVMDDTLRRLAGYFLKSHRDNGKWERLHQGAKELYENWAERFPKHAEYFMTKAKYHADALGIISATEVPSSPSGAKPVKIKDAKIKATKKAVRKKTKAKTTKKSKPVQSK